MSTLLNNFPELAETIEFVRTRHVKGDGSPQTRIHGAPYYLHCVAVAEIIYDYNIHVVYNNESDILTTLRAALCHDLLEDTKTTYEELVGLYGEDVAETVKTLTKPKESISFSHGKDDPVNKQFNALRAYLGILSSPQKCRAALIKAADRTHNLSELGFTRPAFALRYFTDTVVLLPILEQGLEELPGSSKILGAVRNELNTQARLFVEKHKKLVLP